MLTSIITRSEKVTTENKVYEYMQTIVTEQVKGFPVLSSLCLEMICGNISCDSLN